MESTRPPVRRAAATPDPSWRHTLRTGHPRGEVRLAGHPIVTSNSTAKTRCQEAPRCSGRPAGERQVYRRMRYRPADMPKRSPPRSLDRAVGRTMLLVDRIARPLDDPVLSVPAHHVLRPRFPAIDTHR